MLSTLLSDPHRSQETVFWWQPKVLNKLKWLGQTRATFHRLPLAFRLIARGRRWPTSALPCIAKAQYTHECTIPMLSRSEINTRQVLAAVHPPSLSSVIREWQQWAVAVFARPGASRPPFLRSVFRQWRKRAFVRPAQSDQVDFSKIWKKRWSGGVLNDVEAAPVEDNRERFQWSPHKLHRKHCKLFSFPLVFVWTKRHG